MRKLGEVTVVLFKELKSMIRDPKILIAMIIIPFIITGVMYFIIIQSMQQAIREATRETGIILVLDYDRGRWSRNLTNYLEKIGYNIVEINSREELLEKIVSNTSTYGLVIPIDFSNNISSNRHGFIEIYLPIRSTSFLSIANSMKLYSIVSNYSRYLSRTIVEEYGLNSTYVFNPINTSTTVIIRSMVIEIEEPGALTTIVFLTSFLYPLLILILSSFLIQLTATSIAVEKEEKMLETILSLPISRFKFILAKITASILIGLLGLAIYAGLFTWFFSAVSSTAYADQEYVSSNRAVDTVEILGIYSKIYGLKEIILIIINLALSIIFILSLSIILALFTEDVRSAQLITQYLIMPLVFTVLANMFVDLSTIPLSLKYALSIIPIVNAGLIPIFIFNAEYVSIYLVLVSTLIYTIVSVYIASKLIATEKIFTTKLFRRFRK